MPRHHGREGHRRESGERERGAGGEGERVEGGWLRGLRYLGFVLYLLRRFSLTCLPLKIGVLTEAVMLMVTASINDWR